MDYSNSWTDYLYRVQHYMEQQDRKVKELERRLINLENDYSNMNKNHTTIEKLEYHFDQLKIERMDGTLHIGLSPEDLSKVDDFSLNKQPLNNFQQQPKPLKQELIGQLDSYVVNEGPGLLNQLTNEYGVPMNQSYQEMLLNDVRKQLPNRVSHYETQAKEKHSFRNEQELSDHIFDQVQQEIAFSLRKFFEQEKSKGEKQ